MAVVYKAYDTRLETEVAVKVIRTERLIPEYRERTLKRFQIEAKKMARMTHPNIVNVMDYGEYEGAPYLVMPFIPGGTLKELLGSIFSVDEAVNILLPIAEALSYAHREGLIHREKLFISDSYWEDRYWRGYLSAASGLLEVDTYLELQIQE